jgi:hypothetical protein
MTGQADKKKNRFAAHDQMDRNGAGCWAAQRRLAKLASCGEARLSDTISDLRDFGYLKSQKNPQRVHQRVHRIIYNEQDSRWDQDVSRTFPIGKAAKSGNFPNREKIPPSWHARNARMTLSAGKIRASEHMFKQIRKIIREMELKQIAQKRAAKGP